MAANTSQHKMRSRTLDAPLRAYAGLQLAITCRQCPGERPYLVRDIDASYPGLTVGQALLRLRCRDCGAPPAEVVLRSWPGVRPGRRIVLVGPGAYG